MLPTLTYKDVKRALEEAVAEKGADFRYNEEDELNGFGPCLYVPDPDAEIEDPRSTTGCLLGVATAKLGVEWTDGDVASISQYTGERFHIEEGRVMLAMASAQQAQDTGGTWGEALDLFNDTYENMSYDV
jgi:hypothetical protein